MFLGIVNIQMSHYFEEFCHVFGVLLTEPQTKKGFVISETGWGG
jgi:hypothetical protein